ncbi:ATP-binding cassette domain-containing protein [Paeniglutamicibacter psychrophenolicus]|uniref:ATP-binding cassette domain-containing protein n=1 Tax=Paeniglutamicibacter psychrophenolicus TaxID=257454 RepID=UPI0027895D09|nr:ABC transporter ATP-binding protein [Paeniglutamicibacter psychrophenolicus]MDQ0094478.1 energy-coupling factor transport system ATP-binding protein [Paeniglutamicibacter psychrophenolicus]
MSTGPNRVLGLELARFRYSGASRDTLSGINLSLAPGSLTVVLGDSGSGKSTLGAVLAGMLPRHDGDALDATLHLAGQRIRHRPGAAVRIDPVGWARQVGLLPQDARHYLSGVRATVAEELALGLENAGVPRAQMHRRIAALADRLELHALLDRDPAQLSGGQERLVALAALALDTPTVLVLDEPLAGLDAAAAARICEMLDRLRSGGTALVLLARAVDRLTAGADTVLALRAGSCHELDTAVPADPAPLAPAVRGAPGTPDEVLLGFSGVGIGYPGSAHPVVECLELTVRASECVGLAGPNGSGKTTVLKAAAGLLRPSAGQVHGKSLAAGTVGLLLQNPSDQLFERTVAREVAFGLPRRGPAAARIPAVLDSLGLGEHAQAHPYELPASARRLVALATVLVREPEVLLLDEPTEALDAHGLALLHAALAVVLDRGGAVLLATHDEAFMAATAHRVHRMGPAVAARVRDRTGGPG